MKNTPAQSLEEREQEVLATLGRTLLIVQLTEQVVKTSMQVVLRKHSVNTLDTILAQNSEEATKTLGYFLSQLRMRAYIEEGFDNKLKEFLCLRNQFTHNLSEIDGLEFETVEGLAIANEYILRVASLAAYVLKIFMGLIRSWQEQIGMQDDLNLADNEVFQEVDRDFKPGVDYWFRTRKS